VKIYKKRMAFLMITREEVIFFGHPVERKMRYNNKEVLRLSQGSILNNVQGLVGIFQGHLVKLNEGRVGVEEKKLEIMEVRVRGRLLLYESYMRKVGSGRSGSEIVLEIIRWHL
jgi:hypothetical protein